MSECGICLCENTLFDSWRKIFRNHKLFSREVPGVFSPWPPGSRLMSHSWPSSREVVWPEDISQPVNHTQNQHWTWGCRGLTAKRVGAKCDVLKRVLFWSCEISSVNSQDYLRVVWQFTAFSDTVALQRVCSVVSTSNDQKSELVGIPSVWKPSTVWKWCHSLSIVW